MTIESDVENLEKIFGKKAADLYLQVMQTLESFKSTPDSKMNEKVWLHQQLPYSFPDPMEEEVKQ